ncbi:MAG: AAA family ATPase, partial [Chlamydiae bacterium]|nr:AAA family ATPase [Chlamydiota bacterium]
MLALPFSLQSFSRLRETGCLYVDKTKFAYDLIRQQQSFFLARPRRFGKSLFVSTLKEILHGHKELFEGLFIADSDYIWEEYGVIHLDLAPIKSKNAESVEQS